MIVDEAALSLVFIVFRFPLNVIYPLGDFSKCAFRHLEILYTKGVILEEMLQVIFGIERLVG